MSLNFEQLAKLKCGIYAINRSNLNEKEREVQFERVFKRFEAQMRFSFEYEKGRNTYSVESKSPITEEEMSVLVKDIINKQSKYHLHRKDKVVLKYFEIKRNYNTNTHLYKIEIRKGKNLALKGPDMFLGQLLVRGTADWNQDKAGHKRVYVSPDIPFCDRKKANKIKMTARAIRESGSGNTSYFTRLDVQHDQRKIELLVKKKTGKKSGKWQKIEQSDIDENLKNRYKDDLETKRQLYVPKDRRTSRAPRPIEQAEQTDRNRKKNGTRQGAGNGREGVSHPPYNAGNKSDDNGSRTLHRGNSSNATSQDTPPSLRDMRSSPPSQIERRPTLSPRRGPEVRQPK